MSIELDIISLKSDMEDCIYIMDCLRRFLGRDDIRFSLYSLESGNLEHKHGRPVLLTGDFVHGHAKKFYHDSTIISAKRIIVGQGLERMILLPQNTPVYVVNVPMEAALDTIENLRGMGVSHLQLIPFVAGETPVDPKVRHAVTTGYRAHCPEGLAEIVDIGKRPLSFSTMAQIIIALRLDEYSLDIYHNYFNEVLVNSSYQIAGLLNSSESLRAGLDYVCMSSSEGIICVNRQGAITICNHNAAQILRLPRDVQGSPYVQCLEEHPELRQAIEQEDDFQDKLLALHKQNVVVSKHQNSTMKVITLKPVAAIQKTEIQIRRRQHEKGHQARYTFDNIVGRSGEIVKTRNLAKKYAKSDHTVLLYGESGTGKEVFAQAIHNASARKEAPFIAVNFAALPEALIESELFGHKEGAFTGALKGGRTGLFEAAHMGTIFLDEIGDAPLSFQTRLLRVLEEREVMRVGSNQVIPVDVRIICATNKNLPLLIEKNLFRADLYYRIRVIPLTIPTLRERKDDIALLVDVIGRDLGLADPVSEKSLRYFSAYGWPGNIRELKAVLQYLSVATEGFSNYTDGTLDEIVEDYFTNVLRVGHIADDSHPLSGQDLDNSKAVLATIADLGRLEIRAGRGQILRRLAESHPHITEFRLKKMLPLLSDNGLIAIGKTRQGTCITAKGQDFLRRLKSDRGGSL